MQVWKTLGGGLLIGFLATLLLWLQLSSVPESLVRYLGYLWGGAILAAAFLKGAYLGRFSPQKKGQLILLLLALAAAPLILSIRLLLIGQ